MLFSNCKFFLFLVRKPEPGSGFSNTLVKKGLRKEESDSGGVGADLWRRRLRGPSGPRGWWRAGPRPAAGCTRTSHTSCTDKYTGVSAPHHFHGDPDLAFHFNTDPGIPSPDSCSSSRWCVSARTVLHKAVNREDKRSHR
jgi:hypothetical protein